MHFFNILIDYFQVYPYIVVFFSFSLLIFFIPVPEELILLTGGFLSANNLHHHIIWLPTLIAGISGIILTDFYFFIMFRKFGHKLINNKFFKLIISKKKIYKVIRYFHRYGLWAIFIVRFIPGGVRIPTFSIAGLTRIPRRKFILAVAGGAIISSQISFWLGYWGKNKFGNLANLFRIISKDIFLVFIITTAFIVIYLAARTIVLRVKKTNT
jgi:membrane protein DedA with SNARE-associated domain